MSTRLSVPMSPARAACERGGSMATYCGVETKTTGNCAATNPICETTTSTCVPCISDKQCSDKLGPEPGVTTGIADPMLADCGASEYTP
jgi:hypothetical protein